MDELKNEAFEEDSVFEYTWKLSKIRDIMHNAEPYLRPKEITSTEFRSHRGNYEWILSFNQITHLVFDVQMWCTKFTNIYQEKEVEILIKNTNIKHKKTFNKHEVIQDENCHKKIDISYFVIDASEILMDDNDLIIMVKIIATASIYTPNMYKLSHDFEKLLNSGDHSDFKIVIGEKEFLVHKSILSSRSEYFSYMFKHETMEQTCNTVRIPDVDQAVMGQILQYIYCAKFNISEDLLYEFLTAVDMYQIIDLKKKCEERIIQHLNTNNVGECMLYAERFNNKRLKDVTVDFLVEHASEFSEDNKNLLKSSLESVSLSFMISLAWRLMFKQDK